MAKIKFFAQWQIAQGKMREKKLTENEFPAINKLEITWKRWILVKDIRFLSKHTQTLKLIFNF